MAGASEFEVVLHGATGFTGRFVAEYLTQRARDVPGFRWALSGRSRDRLIRLRSDLRADDVGIVEADASDEPSLDRLVSRTRVVLTTVGPYQAYGTGLLEACVRCGTDYVDLCGEPHWMRAMIDAQEKAARAAGARILFSAGFDSVPSELGMQFLQQLAVQRLGAPTPRVRGRVVTFVGGPSGGSVASGALTAAAAVGDPGVARLLADPFALTPGFRGPAQPTGREAGVESDVGPVRPFMLGPTDVQNVHRSNALRGHPYGTDLVYDELLIGDAPSRTAAPRTPPPAPGEGPEPSLIADGRFELLFIGTAADGREVRATVTGSRDPGYGTTARIVTETALLLAADRTLPGGIWTPGAAFGDRLIEVLEARADMMFAAADEGGRDA